MSVVADSELVLHDVPGPSVLGGGWRRSFELLYLIAVNEFKRTYFGTALGYLWSLARPLLLFAVLVVVFTKLVKLSGDLPPGLYPVFLLMNIVLFGFFQEATNNSVQSIVLQEPIVRKTQFPRLIIPLAVVLTSLFNLGLNLVVVLIFLFAFGVTPVWTWLLFPAVLVLILTVAVSMIVSSLYPRFRDVGIIWSVLSTVLFYMTPIMYPISLLRSHHIAQHVIPLNPLVPIFELARKWIIQPDAPDLVAAAGGVPVLLGSIAIYLGVCAFAVWIFRREAPRIAEAL
jgi:ABC-2 type transport system permease protein